MCKLQAKKFHNIWPQCVKNKRQPNLDCYCDSWAARGAIVIELSISKQRVEDPACKKLKYLCSTRASFGNTQADVSDRDKLTYLKYNGTHNGSEQFNSTARVFTPLFTTLKSFLMWAALAAHIYPKML